LACIDRALANKPQSPQLHLMRARYCEGLARYFEAEAAFRRVRELNPATGEVELLNFLLRRERYREAIAMVDAAGTDGVNDALVVELNVAAARAMIAHQAGDPVPFLEAALRRAPGCGTALAAYEEVLKARNDVAGLARLHAEELRAPLVDGADYVRRVHRLLAMGDPATAWEVGERGLEIAPLNAELRFNAGLALARLGRDAEAADQLGRIDDRFPEVYPAAMQVLAALFMRMGDRPRAVLAMRDWVTSQGSDANAVVTGAQWLVQNGARRDARALLSDHAASDPRVAMELASLLLADGDVEAAGSVAERALH